MDAGTAIEPSPCSRLTVAWLKAPISDMLAQHGLDPATTRAAIQAMLDEQPLPLRAQSAAQGG